MTLTPTTILLSDELRAAIDAARGDESQGAFVERILWESYEIIEMFPDGCEPPARQGPGRPKNG